MASGRVWSQGHYAKNMYRCPDEWLRLVEQRATADGTAREQRAESEFLTEPMKRRLHIIERTIDLKV